MARHNREGHGADQRGQEYEVSYQPDWLRLVKVTRTLETGRQSTKTLFRNPAENDEAEPGDRVRTRVRSSDESLDFEVSISDPRSAVSRIRVTCLITAEDGSREEVEFSLDSQLPRSRG